jgi:hypothetical protein
MSAERESLFASQPIDRWCLAPCPEQLAVGECDCTRRIAGEVEEATKRALASFSTVRPAQTEACFDYDAIAALVAWNDPDHEHTRWQLEGCLRDLVETAIRTHEERES